MHPKLFIWATQSERELGEQEELGEQGQLFFSRQSVEKHVGSDEGRKSCACGSQDDLVSQKVCSIPTEAYTRPTAFGRRGTSPAFALILPGSGLHAVPRKRW